jgi:hypothetical protein
MRIRRGKKDSERAHRFFIFYFHGGGGGDPHNSGRHNNFWRDFKRVRALLAPRHLCRKMSIFARTPQAPQAGNAHYSHVAPPLSLLITYVNLQCGIIRRPLLCLYDTFPCLPMLSDAFQCALQTTCRVQRLSHANNINKTSAFGLLHFSRLVRPLKPWQIIKMFCATREIIHDRYILSCPTWYRA